MSIPGCSERIRTKSVLFILPLMMGMAATGYFAQGNETYNILREDRVQLEAQIKNLTKILNDNKIRKDQIAADDDDIGEFAGDCDEACDPSKGASCSYKVFEKVLNLKEEVLKEGSPKRPQDLCQELYEADPTLRIVRSTDRFCLRPILRCGYVKKKMKLKELEKANKDLSIQMDALQQQKREVTREMSDIYKTCPQCVLADRFKPREPKLGDYILGGLQALQPAFLSALSLGLGIFEMKAGAGMYQNYLNQCATIGVPCLPPSFSGGGIGGLGGGGLSLNLNGGGLGIPSSVDPTVAAGAGYNYIGAGDGYVGMGGETGIAGVGTRINGVGDESRFAASFAMPIRPIPSAVKTQPLESGTGPEVPGISGASNLNGGEGGVFSPSGGNYLGGYYPHRNGDVQGGSYYNPYMNIGLSNPQFQAMPYASFQNGILNYQSAAQNQDFLRSQREAAQTLIRYQQLQQQMSAGYKGSYYNPYMPTLGGYFENGSGTGPLF